MKVQGKGKVSNTKTRETSRGRVRERSVAEDWTSKRERQEIGVDATNTGKTLEEGKRNDPHTRETDSVKGEGKPYGGAGP